MIDLTNFVCAEDASHTATINFHKQRDEAILENQNKIANRTLAAIAQGRRSAEISIICENYLADKTFINEVFTPFAQKGYQFMRDNEEVLDGFYIWNGIIIWGYQEEETN